MPGGMHFARVIERMPNTARCLVDSGRDGTHQLATFVATVFERIRSEIRRGRTAQMLVDGLADQFCSEVLARAVREGECAQSCSELEFVKR